MRAVIVILGFPPKTPQPVANRFVQKFYGQDAVTRDGQYRYRKVGLLDSLPHRKLRRGVVILRAQDLPKVEQFLAEWKVEHEVRVIQPTPKDLAALSPIVE
jgi:hypothetical protein